MEDTIEAKYPGGRSLLTVAAEGGSVDVFDEAVNLMGGKVYIRMLEV